MSQTKNKGVSWVGWIFSAALIAASIALWTQRQNIVDAVQYYQYTPSAEVEDVATKAGLTDDARFTFYATHPAVESSQSFNQHCQRKEANSPILGCYTNNRVYIFNVTDERLAGLKTVTAAHELLHAEFDRLPESEKSRLQPLLQAAYEKNTNSDLEARMAYYEKTEPGQSINELHSIAGTEFSNLSPELEEYYKRYFKDRAALSRLHAKVDATFSALSEEADVLVNQIEKLASKINLATKQYNENVTQLNKDVSEFNQKATEQGGFTTQNDFQAARRDILARSNQLSEDKQQIQADVATYKTLISRLDSINAESAELNQSLDSTLSDTPTI